MSKIYRRKDLAKECGVHVNTIYRLEKLGKLPPPGRLKHNKECIYRDEHKEALEKYLSEGSGLPFSALKEHLSPTG